MIVRNMQRHRHQELIRFPNEVAKALPSGEFIHVVLDNHAAHKHAKVRAGLDRHPRWTFHVTPTSSSWLNAVEGFFGALTRRRLKHRVFHSVADLQAAINRYVRERNAAPKPFVWRVDQDAIIAVRARGAPSVEGNPWGKIRFIRSHIWPPRAGSMNSRSGNRPYVIGLTRFPGGEPHTLRLKAL